MSLLMDALKKAEKARQEREGQGEGDESTRRLLVRTHSFGILIRLW